MAFWGKSSGEPILVAEWYAKAMDSGLANTSGAGWWVKTQVDRAALLAMRELPPEQRPKQVIGCEVWRNLDWLPDEAKFLMDVSGRDNLAAALNGVFVSQIAGGKRYDLATLGRRAANATFLDSHSTDAANQLIFGIDLTPLVIDDTSDIVAFVNALIEGFRDDVCRKLTTRPGQR